MEVLHNTVSFQEFQEFIKKVYGVSNDRQYSVWDLLTQQQRFSMRALKGIRKHDISKTAFNLLIALSWLMNIANRFHIDVAAEVWKRFPGACSYCGTAPCSCSTVKPESRKHVSSSGNVPRTIQDFQLVFAKVYPPDKRTLAEAGVHLAEEVGEVSEAVSNYLGQHRDDQLREIEAEIADLISCIFGVANSAHIELGDELARLYEKGCHECHKEPCECNFEKVAAFKS
jgi:NTP pyrophosphatase (non-canonical NTP hydrolase)